VAVDFPPGKRCAVVLTFDMDGQTAFMGGRSKTDDAALLSRGEFGPRVGAPRILELLARYDIPATWFVPGLIADTYPELVRRVFSTGHEIGHHGYNHEHFPTAFKTREEEAAVLLRGIESIFRVTGARPLGFRAPEDGISKHTVQLLLQNGFLYDCSMSAEDYRPYRVRAGDRYDVERGIIQFGAETELVELPFYQALDDFPIFERWRGLQPGLRPPSVAREIWLSDFDYCYQRVEHGVWILVCHPFVIGRGHRMALLEEVIEHIHAQEGIWWARCIDIVRAFRPDRSDKQLTADS
jgi:peptidoglycan/xylan/chitin deacetylase (PgdA/CDA1 family)